MYVLLHISQLVKGYNFHNHFYCNQSKIEFNQSQYCFVNECTIKINDSSVLLNIINKIGDWITATNTDLTKDRSTLAVTHDRYCADFTIAILTASLVCAELPIVADQTDDKSAEDKQCADFFSHKNCLTTDNQLAISFATVL